MPLQLQGATIYQQLLSNGLTKILDNAQRDKYYDLTTDLEELITVFGNDISELTVWQANQYPQHQQQIKLFDFGPTTQNQQAQILQFQDLQSHQVLQTQQSQAPGLQIKVIGSASNTTNQQYQMLQFQDPQSPQILQIQQSQAPQQSQQQFQMQQLQIQHQQCYQCQPRFLYQDSETQVLIKKSLLPKYTYIGNIQLQTLQIFQPKDYSKLIIVTDTPDREGIKRILQQQGQRQKSAQQEPLINPFEQPQLTALEQQRQIVINLYQKYNQNTIKTEEIQLTCPQKAAILAVLKIRVPKDWTIQDFLDAYNKFLNKQQ